MQAPSARFAAGQIQGGRDYQEDDYGMLEGHASEADAGHDVLVVADGMGGHVGGSTASAIVVRTVIETYPQTTGPVTDRLSVCLTTANSAVAEAIKERPELDGMGSTLLAVAISPQGLDWVSVGDSPLWLFRDSQLTRLNADHSMAPVLADLVAVGRMTAEEAADDSRKHSLRSAVIGEDLPLVDVSPQSMVIQEGDCVLLASDGLMTLDEQQISRILRDTYSASPNIVATALLDAVTASDCPYQDNATVLLYNPAASPQPQLTKHRFQLDSLISAIRRRVSIKNNTE